MTNLAKRDQELIWHPFTQEKLAPLPIVITRGKGSYLYDEDNKAYLDLISSWWLNLHGHAEPNIAKAIYQQASQLEQVIFAGFTHQPAIELCEQLNNLLPTELGRFFFSDNGSTAVEIALKIAHQYWLNHDKSSRELFLCFDGAYHGDTFGAMSVGASSGFHNNFHKLLFRTLVIPWPATWDEDQNFNTKEASALLILDQYLLDHHNKIAALILEPLVQGASGMRICRVEFIEQVIVKVRKYNILIIFDEVMTGFGRTGKNFALDYLIFKPDLLCLAKGITGGFLPLALTITNDKIYQAFYKDDYDMAFMHGHSYTANPLACAAAIASLKIFNQDSTKDSIYQLNESHLNGIKYLRNNCQKINKTRVIGTIAAFELDIQVDYQLAVKIRKLFLERGLLIRPLANTIYLIPPYSTTSCELEQAYQKIAQICNELVKIN